VGFEENKNNGKSILFPQFYSHPHAFINTPIPILMKHSPVTPIPMGIPWDPWDPSRSHSYAHLYWTDRRTDTVQCIVKAAVSMAGPHNKLVEGIIIIIIIISRIHLSATFRADSKI